MRKIACTAALAIVALSACEKSISEPEGPLTGTWHYRAVDLMFGAVAPNDWRCTVDVRLDIVQTGNVVEGVTRPSGPSVCRNLVTGATDLQPLTEFPLAVKGEVQDGRVHFSFSGGYHSFGELHPTVIQGYVEEYGAVGDGPITAYRVGEFTLSKD